MTAMLLFSAALNLPAYPPPPKGDAKPLGPAPRVVLLNTDADGKVRLQARITETVKVTLSVNGEQKTEDRKIPVLRETAPAELEKLTVFTADGKELNRATALEKLSAGVVVVVSSDGEKVDPTYLKAFKDDTLVLVSPQLNLSAPRPAQTAATAAALTPAPGAVVPAMPIAAPVFVPALRPVVAPPPPKVEKKDDKKDEKKDPPKKDDKKG